MEKDLCWCKNRVQVIGNPDDSWRTCLPPCAFPCDNFPAQNACEKTFLPSAATPTKHAAQKSSLWLDRHRWRRNPMQTIGVFLVCSAINLVFSSIHSIHAINTVLPEAIWIHSFPLLLSDGCSIPSDNPLRQEEISQT